MDVDVHGGAVVLVFDLAGWPGPLGVAAEGGRVAVGGRDLTAGPDEVRAWPVPDGSTAVDAAGAIHTDLARGFIRAETVAYEDLLKLGSMGEAKKAGRLRSEGKTYRVKDGDVLEILFSR